MKPLDDKRLNNMNDRNLLAYYKAERKRYYSWSGKYICDCCGERLWTLHNIYLEEEKKDELWWEYLSKIKLILSSRSHVKKKNETISVL